jgi:flagellar motor component MotA
MALNAKTAPNYVPKRINGKFAPGWSGNPGGSLEATRRSFNKDFLLALAADFKKHGAAAIEKVREQQPAAYMKICALLVPREMKVEHSSTIKQMSDEQIEQAIEYIQTMLAAQAGEAAKVIEGEAEVVPSLPAPGSGGTKMPKA